MSLTKMDLNAKCQLEGTKNFENAKDALARLKDYGVEAKLSNIDIEHSVAEDDNGAVHMNFAIQEVVKNLKLFVEEDACLICGGDVEDIRPFFDEEKKSVFVYFRTDDMVNFEKGFWSTMKKVKPDILEDVSKVLLMFHGDFNLMQVTGYGEKVLSALPMLVDMTTGFFYEDGASEKNQDSCDNPECGDKVYAEILCLMI